MPKTAKSKKQKKREKDFQEAAASACIDLQTRLNKRAKGDFLDRVALCIMQGLMAKKTFFATWNGEFSDQRVAPDHKTRATYCSLGMDVFGAKAPQKHELSGKDGGPLDITLVWPENGNGSNGD